MSTCADGCAQAAETRGDSRQQRRLASARRARHHAWVRRAIDFFASVMLIAFRAGGRQLHGQPFDVVLIDEVRSRYMTR